MVLGLFISSIVLVVLSWCLLLFLIPKGDQIILHYNVYFGSDFAGNWENLFIIPIIGSAFLFLNFMLAKMVLKSNQFSSLLFSIGTVVIEVFVFLSLLMLFIINK